MSTLRCTMIGAVLAAASAAAPAAAGGTCGGHAYVDVPSLRMTISAPSVRRGRTQVSVHVTRASGLAVAQADVTVGRGRAGAVGFGRAVTDERGIAVVELTRTVPSQAWERRATASRVTGVAHGCTAAVVETGATIA